MLYPILSSVLAVAVYVSWKFYEIYKQDKIEREWVREMQERASEQPIDTNEDFDFTQIERPHYN